MATKSRILSNLIEGLEDIKGKLLILNREKEWMYCSLPKEESRSYINTKNILETLVMKTVEGKGYDEDIASICNQNKPFLEKHLELQVLFDSDEYLKEARNLSSTSLRFEFLHNSLIMFQDFLGDILHSVCQISSCQLKLPSKILVKDLLKIKNQYLSIWDNISSVFRESKCKREPNLGFIGESKEAQSRISDILKCLRISLKEMSKVKLEIDHYFKQNLVEMQFTKLPSEKGDSITSLSVQKVHFKEEKLENSTEMEYSLLKRIGSSSQALDPYDKRISNCSMDKKSEKNHSKRPSMLFEEREKTINEWYNCFPARETWNNVSDSSFQENYRGEFCKKPLIFPQNFILFEPTTVLLQSKMNEHKRNSLPKIYSIDDSFNENKNEITSCKSQSFQKIIDSNHKNADPVKKAHFVGKVESMISLLSKNTLSEEDIFKEKKSRNQNDSYSICLQEKISSLFDMMLSSKTNFEEEDIFEERTLKNKPSRFTYQKPHKNNQSSQSFVDHMTAPKNTFNMGKYHNTNLKNKTKCNIFQKHVPLCKENNENYSIEGESNYLFPLHCNKIQDYYNNNTPMTKAKEVVYKKRSMIELYHTKEASCGSNTRSLQGDQSTLNVWPVAAEYIHVSKRNSPYKSQSMLSDNSIPLTKSFEKSFYSLHLNKRYEQKQLYDGDLLVLDNPERSNQQESSNHSMLNSDVVFNQQKIDTSFERRNDTQYNVSDELDKQKQIIGERNKAFELLEGRNNKIKDLKDVKKTLAAHYKDCGDSFKVTEKHFNSQNYDFFKVNEFDNNSNWNSFISIFTSKVGQTARIDHHRMFRKVINTFTTDSITCNNVFGNVHTLTSNGGPFRLFDINGYPLTDSAGNVLKDPYGKSVATLDSTGFPKVDIKVFDSAGNSPRDINFDPTQKPKTNSIIIKLTDNFKRPLHLFDKYGRPLTDSCGKLLVNIHGRPLLRFDNFGRPNTDYRGGPLYTDNGYRWSYKTGDSLSSDQLSNESIIPKKLCDETTTKSIKNSCENLHMKEKNIDSNKNALKNIGLINADKNKTTNINDKKSDIWIKVESVLRQFPKSKHIDAKTSQTSVIINNVTIDQNQIEKEFLKTIIYHNNIIQQDIDHYNRMNYQPTSHKANFDFQNMNKCLLSKRLTAGNNVYCMGDTQQTNLYNANFKTALPFSNNIFLKKGCSKCLSLDHIKKDPSNKLLTESIFNFRKTLNLIEGETFKKLTLPTITSYPKDCTKNTMSYLTFKNHDYVNKLCNKILKHDINYSDKVKDPILQECVKEHDWTDTSLTEFTSSNGSKYTTEFTSQTESPVYFSGTTKVQTQGFKNVADDNNNNFIKQQPHLDSFMRGKDCPYKEKYCNDYIKTEGIKNESMRQKTFYNNREQTNDYSKKKSILSLPNSTAMSLNILNRDIKHYEIKVSEMLSKILNPKTNVGLYPKQRSSFVKKNSHHLTPKIEHNILQQRLKDTDNVSNTLIEQKHTMTENVKGKTNHSLFRFTSDDKLESTLQIDNNNKKDKTHTKVSNSKCSKNYNKFYNEDFKNINDKTHKNKMAYSNINHNDIKPSRHIFKIPLQPELSNFKKDREHKHFHIERKNANPIKKHLSLNRECNLVTFFGSPVKYVLNKLDGTRSFRPNSINVSNKKNTHRKSKENVKRSSVDAIKSKSKTKQCNDLKIKTIYEISKSSKKRLLSSNEKANITSYDKKEQDRLLVFQSKSCNDLLQSENGVQMSYSGDNDSENANNKKHSLDLPFYSAKLGKSMSATNYANVENTKNIPLRENEKYEQRKETPKVEQYSTKTNTIKRKYTNPDRKTEKSSKSQKQSSGRHQKSPLFSSRNKAKQISLFKKVEPEGKYMLKIKK